MVFFRGGIIRLSSVDFIVKIAKKCFFAVATNFRTIFVTLCFETYTFVFRGGGGGFFSAVTVILGQRCQPEIFPAVVKAAMVLMVNYETLRRLHNLIVHIYSFSFFKPNRIKRAAG